MDYESSYCGRAGLKSDRTDRRCYGKAYCSLNCDEGYCSRRTSSRSPDESSDEYLDDMGAESGSETDDLENDEEDWVYIGSSRRTFGLSTVMEVGEKMRRVELDEEEKIKQRMAAEKRYFKDILYDTTEELRSLYVEKADLEDSLCDTEKDLRVSELELKRKNRHIEKLDASLYNCAKEIECLQRRVSEKGLTITDQYRIIDDYKLQVWHQQQTLNNQRTFHENAKKESDLIESTKIKSLRDANKQLEKELQDALMKLEKEKREISTNTKKWQLKVTEKENEISKLKSDLKKQTADYERKLKIFQTEDKHTDVANRVINFKTDKLEKDIERLSKENKRLQDELSREKENARTYKKKWDTKNTELRLINESQKQELQASQEKAKLLEEELQNMHQQKMRLQVDSKACKENVSAKIRQEYKSLEEIASKTRKDLELCYQEKKKLQDELTQQKDKTQRLEEEVGRQKGKMQDQINSHLREIKLLKAANDELTRQPNAFSKLSAPSANDVLRQQLEATNEQLRNELRDKDQEKFRLQEDFDACKENIAAENRREYKALDEIARKTRKDLERCQQEKKKLQDELDQERVKVQSLDKDVRRQNDDLQLQIRSHLKEIEMLKTTNDKLTRQLSKQKTVYSSPTGNDDLTRQLEATKEQLRIALKDRDEAQTRLSRAMGDRLTDNNPNIADLSDKNRPTKLSERYQELYDNQWTDAFEIIDRSFNNEEKTIAALKTLLTKAMEFCKAEAVKQLKQVEEIFAKGARIPKDMVKPLKDYRKALAEQYGEGLYKDYMRHLNRSHSEEDSLALQVPAFVKECFDICWLMAVQDPPVVLGPDLHRGSSFNKDHYKAYTKSGERVRFTVWPVLLLHEDGPVLCKGVAQGN